MYFLTGVYAIYASAAALNNGAGKETKATVKTIRVQHREYPYVSAQALRYWLRETLRRTDPDWQASPVYRGKGKQQAYTEGNPLRYADDDLLGYMRAEKETGTLTRIAPFRTGTLVSAAPVEITGDFGVMARDGGDPVLHQHEFYRATLVSTFSLDLSAVGTFYTGGKGGYRNLNDALMTEAQNAGLAYLPERGAYRLPVEERLRRVTSLLRAFARLDGGAKQTLHHTDVSPALVCMAVLRGGNNPFMNLVAPSPVPALHTGALDEALSVYAYESEVVVGLRQGFMDSAYAEFEKRGLAAVHPRAAFDHLIQQLWDNPQWLD